MNRRKILALILSLSILPGAYAVYHFLGMELTGYITAEPGVETLIADLAFDFTGGGETITDSAVMDNDAEAYEMLVEIDQSGVTAVAPCVYEPDVDVAWEIRSNSYDWSSITDDIDAYVMVDAETTTQIDVKGTSHTKICEILSGETVSFTGTSLDSSDYLNVPDEGDPQGCGATATFGSGGSRPGQDVVEHYFGDNAVNDGWEYAIEFTDGSGGTVDVSWSVGGSGYTVYVLTSTNAMDVIASGATPSFTAGAGETYYIVAESGSDTQTTEGTNDITFTCS